MRFSLRRARSVAITVEPPTSRNVGRSGTRQSASLQKQANAPDTRDLHLSGDNPLDALREVT